MNYQDKATKFWELHKAEMFPSWEQMIAIRQFAGWLEDEVDSESDEPIQTEAYQDIDPDSTYGSFPDEPLDLEDSDWIGDMGDN